MKKINEWIYYYGFLTGLILIAIPIVWDILWIGVRGIFHWSIGGKGILVQAVGLWLLWNGGRDSK